MVSFQFLENPKLFPTSGLCLVFSFLLEPFFWQTLYKPSLIFSTHSELTCPILRESFSANPNWGTNSSQFVNSWFFFFLVFLCWGGILYESMSSMMVVILPVLFVLGFQCLPCVQAQSKLNRCLWNDFRKEHHYLYFPIRSLVHNSARVLFPALGRAPSGSLCQLRKPRQ